MAVPSVSDLTALLRDADPASVRAFAAGLYEGRGHAVTRTDSGFTTDGADGDVETVVVHTSADDPTALPLATASEIVTVDPRTLPDTPARIVDVTDLHRQLLYAIDRPQAATLLADTLDRSIDSFEGTLDESPEPAGSPPTATGTDETQTEVASTAGTERPGGTTGREQTGTTGVSVRQSSTSGDPSRGIGGTSGEVPSASVVDSGADGTDRQHRMVLFGAVALLGLAALAGPGFVGWAGDSSATIGPVASNGTTAATDSGEEELGVRAIPVNGSGLPPGIDASGAIDERRLGDATEAALGDRSYRVSVTYREFSGRQETAVYSETVRVANESHYSASVTRLGEFERGPTIIAGRDLYATPSGTTERTVASGRPQVEFRNGTTPASDLVADDIERYVRWYLSVEESVVTAEQSGSETPVYRLLTEGDPYTGVTNASGSAVVDSDGVVRQLRRTYDEPTGRDLRVVVTIRVSDVGSTTVRRPAWA